MNTTKCHYLRTTFWMLLSLYLASCSHLTGAKDQTPAATANACMQPFQFDKSRTSKQLDLVFEGGGAKGTVFVGALQELQSQGYSGRRFVGTSAGAITATLLAAGYSADLMLAAVNEKVNGKPRFSTFMDVPASFEQEDIMKSYTYDFFRNVDMPFISDRVEKGIDKKIFNELMKHERYRILFSTIERGGVYEGKKFLEWMTEKLDADCRGLGKATFKQFFEKTGNELTVVASNVSRHEKLVLNRVTAPDCPVAWAVRMSMSIPFVWQEVRWDKKWGEYRGSDISGNVVVDGGVLSNFPLNLVVGKDDEIRTIMGFAGTSDSAQLGFLIDESSEVPGAAMNQAAAKKGILEDAMELKTITRVMGLIDTMTDANDQFVMTAHPDKVCRLPAKGYGTTEFDMSDARTKALIEAGKTEAGKCLRTLEGRARAANVNQ